MAASLIDCPARRDAIAVDVGAGVKVGKISSVNAGRAVAVEISVVGEAGVLAFLPQRPLFG